MSTIKNIKSEKNIEKNKNNNNNNNNNNTMKQLTGKKKNQLKSKELI